MLRCRSALGLGWSNEIGLAGGVGARAAAAGSLLKGLCVGVDSWECESGRTKTDGMLASVVVVGIRRAIPLPPDLPVGEVDDAGVRRAAVPGYAGALFGKRLKPFCAIETNVCRVLDQLLDIQAG